MTVAEEDTQLNLFLSYARVDQELAQKLRLQLVADGHKVWQDTEELLTGDDFQTHIRRTLRTCEGYVVLVTPRSLASAWVLIELGGAWVSGIPLFPVIADTPSASVPGPLRDLNCSSVDEVSTKLLPALRRLREQVRAVRIPLIEGPLLEELAREQTASLSPASLRTTIASLVADALSPKRVTRRMAHTTVQQSPSYLRTAFLNVMLDLTRHNNERIRGEAYYCLGYIPLIDNTYMRGQEFFREGLSDESVFVQACCANVLKNFWPLEDSTRAKLEELRTYNILRVSTNEISAKLVYYASIALDYGRSRTLKEVTDAS